MPTYGRFETVRDLFRGGLGTVSIARLEGKGDKDEYVVKAYVITASVRDRSEAEAEAKAFLRRAETMAKLTAAKARHWAPVHEAGLTPTGAFYATDRYKRSLDQLISGRVRLDAAAMWNIVNSIYQGLRELRAACERSHGALKPSNVLLDRVGQVDRARIVLSDPAGTAPEGELGDLRALGRIIYLLVFYQPFRELGGYPLVEAAEWSKLGRKANAWRALCNRLLDPAATPGTLGLDSVAEDIKALRERKRKKGSGLAPIAAAVVLLGGGAAAWYFTAGGGGGGGGGGTDPGVGGPANRTQAEAMWREWMLGSLWLKGLANSKAAQLPDGGLPQGLRDELAKLEGVNWVQWEHNPRKVPGLRVRSDIAMARAAEDPSAYLDSDGDQQRAISHGTAIAGLRAQAREWAVLAAREKRVEEFTSRGWTVVASLIKSRLEDFKAAAELREGSADDVMQQGKTAGDAMAALAEMEPHLARIEAEWAELQKVYQEVAGVNDPELSKLAERVKLLDQRPAFTAGSELRDMPDRIDRVASGFVRVRDALAKWGGKPPEGFEVARGLDSEPDTGAWLEEYAARLSSYRPARPRLENPLNTWDVTGELASLEGKQSELMRRLARDVPENKRGGLEDRLRALGDALGRLRAARQGLYNEAEQIVAGGESGEATREALTQIEQRRRSLDGELANAQREAGAIGQAIDLAIDLAMGSAQARDAIAQMTAPEWSLRLAAVSEAWEGQRQEVLAALDAGTLSDDLAQQRMESLGNLLGDIEEELRDGPSLGATDLSESLSDEDRRGLRNRLDQLVDEKRQEAARRMLAEAALQAGVPRAGAEFDPGGLEAAQQYARWSRSVEQMLKELSRAERLLEDAHPYDERSGEISARSLIEGWSNSGREEWRELQDHLGGLVARAREIESAEQERDSARLVERARNLDDFPVAMASWRALGRVEGWPRPGEEARNEATMYRSLRIAAEGRQWADEDRRTDIMEELTEDGLARYARVFTRARTPQELRDTLNLQDRYGDRFAVETLSRPVRYNLALLELQDSARAVLQKGTLTPQDEEQLRSLAAGFASRVEGLGVEQAGPWVQELIASMAETAAPAASGPRLEDLGPGAAGWVLANNDLERPAYENSDEAGNIVRLEFARVQVGDGDPVYVSTQEVSLGAFVTMVRQSEEPGKIEEIVAQKKWGFLSEVLEGRFTGQAHLRTWVADQTGQQPVRFYPARDWMNEGAASNAYAGTAPPPPRDLGMNVPMQRISIVAARDAARLAGCRLPTVQEWQAAAATETSAVWNLRDELWSAQNERMKRSTDLGAWRLDANNGAFLMQDDSGVAPSDGSLWFEAVDAPRGEVFRHIRGNVAEFVATGGDATKPEGWAVIGGSALWPPSVPTDEPQSWRGLGWDSRAYSDVGFRLAFDAKGAVAAGPTFAQRVERVMENPPWVWE